MYYRSLLVLSLLIGCESEPADPNLVSSDEPRNLDPQVPDGELASFTQSNRTFAFSLYEVLTSGSEENFFYSPHSISSALAMTYAGAEGNTATEMADAMHFDLPEPTLHSAFNRLDLELMSRSEVEVAEGNPPELNVANSIWGRNDYPFVTDYLDLLAVHYGAGLRHLDFAGDPEGARATINGWIADQTEDRIEELLPRDFITGNTVLVLTNAIYFKGSWLNPFEVSQTQDQDFLMLDGSTVSVPMMNGSLRTGYVDYEGYSVVELPFVGQDLSMVLFVPDVGEFASFEAQLDVSTYDGAVSSLSEHDVTLAMPKFEMRTPINLVAPLQQLGMNDAFGAADFSGLSERGGLAITDILHEGFISVDEVGAEAAAATAVSLGESAAPPAEVTLDRPFMFTIVDRPTNSVLFVGRVIEP